MNRFGLVFLILLYVVIGAIGFNYIILEQENILRRYFIIEPQRRMDEAHASLADSLGKYFASTNRAATLDGVAASIKELGRTPLCDLVYIFKDEAGSLKQVSKTGIAPVSNRVLETRWVYPAPVADGRIDGYLVVMIRAEGETEYKEGLRKYIGITYSLRFLFLLLLVAFSIIVLYHHYSARMKLARDLAEIKASNDGLTGLYTHDYFMKALDIELEKFMIYSTPVALMMIDVDNFKAFNDTYGHLAGDKVLQEVAKVIKSNIRSVDILARYGGEEFALIIPYLSKSGGADRRRLLRLFAREVAGLAQRIRQNIEAARIDYNGTTLNVTISAGVAYYFKKSVGISCVGLLQNADRALYRAKEAGKNRVVMVYGSRRRT